MRKFGIVLAALACLSLTAIPSFAAKGDITFGLTGGMAMPMGDFADFFKMGFGGGVYGDYAVAEQFLVGVDGMYNQFSADEDVFGDLDVTFSMINFGAHGKWLPPVKDSPMAPYISVGVGMYNGKIKMEDEAEEESESKIGINGGAGVDFKVNPQFTVGVGGAFHHVMTDEEATQFFTVGVNIGFMTTGATK